MSAGFTPGPWQLRVDGVYLRVVHGEHKTTVADSIVSESNAHLISAAPDLLEALSWFINDIDGAHTKMVEFDANVERARAAIAKALSKIIVMGKQEEAMAFPSQQPGPLGGTLHYAGMSLRQWYAGQAIASCLNQDHGNAWGVEGAQHIPLSVKRAFAIADMMLEYSFESASA